MNQIFLKIINFLMKFIHELDIVLIVLVGILLLGEVVRGLYDLEALIYLMLVIIFLFFH